MKTSTYTYKSCKEIAKEIREAAKQITGVKVSVTSDYNHISVALLSAPWEAITTNESDIQVNQYYMMEDARMTREAKVFFQIVQDIMMNYYYDDSDSMSDYFDCAFYYDFSIGKWNKPYSVN
jgi:hypothetical protein